MDQIKQAIMMPEIYLTLLYFTISCILHPSFYSYWYYFKMNIVKFSKFQYAILNCFSYFSTLTGTVCFNKYFKEEEVRTLMRYGIYLNIFSAFTSLLWVKRINLDYGISDSAFVIITDIVIGTLSMSFQMLPSMVLFAKITPANIEGTCFAFLTGTTNFLYGVLASYIGSLVNDAFIGVTANDLSNFISLAWISLITRFFPLAFLWLIPLKADIEHYKK